MARPLRIEYPSAIYHVMARGQRKEPIFYSKRDRQVFLEKLQEVKIKYNLLIHSYVLMENHYHILLETKEANLSRTMHCFNASYSNWFKAKHNLVGSVYQGRYKSIIVDKDKYLLVVSAYIHLNPVVAGIVDKPEEYGWSSYQNFFYKKDNKKKLVYVKSILEYIGSINKYKNFIYERFKKGIKKEEVYGKNSILGEEDFKESILKGIKKKNIEEYSDLKALKKINKEKIMSDIGKIFKINKNEILKKKRGNRHRHLLIYALKRYSDLKLKEIGQMLGMKYTAVSTNYNRLILYANNNKEIKKQIRLINKKCGM